MQMQLQVQVQTQVQMQVQGPEQGAEPQPVVRQPGPHQVYGLLELLEIVGKQKESYFQQFTVSYFATFWDNV